MLLGHCGVAFALKRAAPKTSLTALVAAAYLLDLLWPVFLLLGWETVSIVPGITTVTPLDFTHYPYSHSLLAVILWSGICGALYFGVTKYGRGALIIGCATASHWVLDFLVHRPDLPLGFTPGKLMGLGLWNSIGITLALELGIFFAGLYIYTRSTCAKDSQGTYALYTLIAVLLLIYAANLLGPPPPSTTMIAYAGNASWLFVLWSYWIEKHRQPRPNPQVA